MGSALWAKMRRLFERTSRREEPGILLTVTEDRPKLEYFLRGKPLRAEVGQVQVAVRRSGYVPSLQGIRGFGFLLVFCGHYFLPQQLAHPGTLRFRILTSLDSFALCAVPTFFVLSGYLIGGILFHTRNREGFFRVFYARRVLRVFPVYYLTLLAVVSFYLLRSLPINNYFWLHFFYIQNLFPSYTSQSFGQVSLVHLWSLAVEEQFYLLWPLVVWFFGENRQQLIKVVLTLIACCCAFRLLAPLVASMPREIVFLTPVRADSILLGVLLALIREDAVYAQLERFAKWAVAAGACVMILLANWKDRAWSTSFQGVEITTPLINVIAVAVLIAVMEQDSWLNRLCSQRWICWLGGLSYSAYVFHLTFAPYFFNYLTGHLCEYMRSSFAVLASGGIAFCLTIVLSLLSFYFIERPAMNSKEALKYGPSPAKTAERLRDEVLTTVGS